MMHYKNLYLIGTSHIATESIQEVEQTIKKEKPAIVALELDHARFQALHSKTERTPSLRDIARLGVKGYLFARIGHYVEHKLGSIVGVKPGSEMLKAAEIAYQEGAKIALIDQPIEKTLHRFSARLTWKEKGRFLYDLLTGFFRKQKITFDLSKVPEKKLIKKMITDVKQKYPSVYKTLIEERNIYMAKRLHNLMQNYEKIVGIVGAGHEEDIISEIKNLKSV